jgi:hypothetical protein
MVADDEHAPSFDTALAARMLRALTVDSEELFQIVLSKEKEILHAVLKNPNLNDSHLVALLKRNDLSEDIIKAIYLLAGSGENHQIKVALVHNPNTPGQTILTLLPHLYLFELINVCYLPGVTADQKLAAERAIIQRLPTTPLGNKLTLARRGTANIIDALLKEGEPLLLEACLSNPRTKESSIFQFLNSNAATPESISTIARHPRWKTRPNLKLAILKNHKTPTIWFTMFLPTIRLGELRDLHAARNLNRAQKNCIGEELKKRGL